MVLSDPPVPGHTKVGDGGRAVGAADGSGVAPTPCSLESGTKLE